MLHVISHQPPDFGDTVLRGMFEARKRVFVDLLHWDVPVIAGRYELDQFDTPHAAYLVVTDSAGYHLASARLLPTTRPHILGSLYADLCDGSVPRGRTVFEITRFCLDRRPGASARRDARDTLIRAIADHGVARGITLFTGVAEIAWLQQILAFGWRCRPLGLPQPIGGTMLGALAIEIDAETPALLARAGIHGAAAGIEELADAA